MKPYYDEDGITIYHADCREVLPAIDPADVSLVLTDPPYGVELNTNYSRFNGGLAHEAVVGDDELFDPTPLLAFPRVVCWGANHFHHRLPAGGTWIIWDKILTNNITRPFAAGEMAWSNAGGKNCEIYRHMWNGAYRDSERSSFWHPTQKPVALMSWILDRWSDPDDLILDPFMGSGPVAQACKQMGRRYIGIEIEERYCEIAVQRLAQGVLDFEHSTVEGAT